MKPTSLATSKSRYFDSFNSAASQSRQLPITDYSYHSGAFDESSAHYFPVRARSFWNIAGDYLKNEARHDFQSEALLFALITITAALPLMNNLHALIEFARAITSH
jgi:hypothetical protein